MPAEARASLASAAATGHPIEIVTAAPLSDEQTRHVRGALKEAFGVDLPFAFRSDPAIVAGIELKGQNAIIRNSWRADLDRIRQELSRDKHASLILTPGSATQGSASKRRRLRRRPSR